MDDFGVKYVGKEHAQHLINVLKKNYMMLIDCDGSLYCGIQSDWDYETRTLNIAIPGYILNLEGTSKFSTQNTNKTTTQSV